MNEPPVRPRNSLPMIGTLAMTALLIGCGPDFIDRDATAQTALGLPTLLTIDGQLDVELGDAIDWKRFTAQADGLATIEVRIGDPFRDRHSVRGTIAVFDRDAHRLVNKTITHDVLKYQLSWRIESTVQYLIRIEATEGREPYSLDLSLDLQQSDPCEGVFCEDDETCEDGECVGLEEGCDPPCEGNEECIDDECVRPANKPCGGKRCPKGQYCSKSKDRCVKDPCRGKRCGSNEVCRRGVCKPKPKKTTTSHKPRGSSGDCDPPCSDGATCKKGKCKYGPLPAKIVQSVPRGETTIITLNKGTSHKIKIGQSGKVSGVGSFRIIEAYEYRSKAILKAAASKLGDKKSATIYR